MTATLTTLTQPAPTEKSSTLKNLFLSAFLLMGSNALAQAIYVSTSTRIGFFAGTPLEDIDAVNTKALSFLNIQTGELTISIPNKEFQFKRSLMQEHFNENYIESGKFPKSDFKGKVTDFKKIDWQSSGSLKVSVTGILTIHGVAKERTIDVMVQLSPDKIQGETTFIIPLADHQIERPRIVWEKLADKVQVTANFTYEPYKK